MPKRRQGITTTRSVEELNSRLFPLSYYHLTTLLTTRMIFDFVISKTIPLKHLTGPGSSKRLSLPGFLEIGHMKVVSFRLLPPENSIWY